MFRSFWRRFWRNAPRQLRFTRQGKILVALALAVGLAAINTGNNLLFLGWGLILSSITLSGFLSEINVRYFHVHTLSPGEQRVGQSSYLPICLKNCSRFFALWGLEVQGHLLSGSTRILSECNTYLYLAEQDEVRSYLAWRPLNRGYYQVPFLVTRTVYPFGFFEKKRKIINKDVTSFIVYPKQVDTSQVESEIFSSIRGKTIAQRGPGDDFFSLRLFRQGDDPKQIYWRRSAQTQKWVVREYETIAQSTLWLELRLSVRELPSQVSQSVHTEHVEYAIAFCASLVERLLKKNYLVGIRSHGCLVPPAGGAQQRKALLVALSLLEPKKSIPECPVQLSQGAHIAIIIDPAKLPRDCQTIIKVPLPITHSDQKAFA